MVQKTSEDRPDLKTHAWMPLFAFTVCLLMFGVVLGRAELISDPDSFMRIVRVEDLLATGDWWGQTSWRSNAPFGEVLHWTRPHDILMIVASLPGMLLGAARPVATATLLLPIALLVATGIAAEWAVRPLAGTAQVRRLWVATAVLGQTAVISANLPGRADHHGLFLLLFTFVLGFSARAFTGQRHGARAMTAAGVFSGLALWTGVESTVAIACVVLVLLVRWVHGVGDEDEGLSFARALFLTAAGALVVERGPGALEVVYDQISIVYVVATALHAAFWTAVGRLGGDGVRRRFSAALGAGAATLALLLAAFPKLVHGPTADVNLEVKRVWLANVAELQPVLMPVSWEQAGMLITCMGLGIVTLGVATYMMRRNDAAEGAYAWLLVAVLLIAFIPLGIREIRWSAYVGVVSIAGAAVILEKGMARAGAYRLPLAQVGGRVALAFAVIPSWLLLGAVTSTFGDGAAKQLATVNPCSVEAVAPRLRALPAHSTIAAHVDVGPELLYRTSHKVLATPYHRNEAGILDTARLLNAVDARTAVDVALARGLDYILICPAYDLGFFQEQVEGEPTLFGEIVRGELPRWLTEVQPRIPFAPGSFVLLRVNRQLAALDAAPPAGASLAPRPWGGI